MISACIVWYVVHSILALSADFSDEAHKNMLRVKKNDVNNRMHCMKYTTEKNGCDDACQIL
jgi:hypothetical protein